MTPTITVTRCIDGRLARAYPAASHDVDLTIEGVPLAELPEVLRREADRALAEDPRCRRVLFGVPEGDLDMKEAVERAGLRFAIDVEIPGAELLLYVLEARWVTAGDPDLDLVPGS